jgi:hypothetical protein
MPIQPQEVFALSKNQQQAYRRLLYHAMLDIRTLCQSRGPESRNPIAWRRQYRLSRIGGALADWLHNLALAASAEFSNFHTDGFWQQYQHLCKRFPSEIGAGKWIDYAKHYEDHLAELNARRHR